MTRKQREAWRQLSVLSRFPEFAEEILLAGGAQSVSFVDAADDPVLEPAPGATPLWPRTRTIGLFNAGQDLAPVADNLRHTLPDGAGAIITSAALAEREWAKVWLRSFRPLKFGERLWVTPQARRRQIRQRRAAVVVLDPGLAFGTGTHPSTALCLEWLAQAELSGKTVLDYGCGSGVLGIAALKLGAAQVTAVDIDPQALRATADNARRNRLAARLTVAAAGAPLGRFDVVLANILANPLVALAPRLGRAVAAGGQLVLSGLLVRQAQAVMAAYRPGIEFASPVRSEGWVRLFGTKRGGRRKS